MAFDPKASLQYCRRRAALHYENFPVASWLLPGSLRGPVAAIYCFARTADDLADEDSRPAAIRAAALRAMQTHLHALDNPADETDPEWQALAWTVQQFNLPKTPLLDLCDAFLQDLTTDRYVSFGEVMAYCRRSANPVGRLLLHLTGEDSAENLGASDALCTALQLINFFQDLEQDFHELGRIYIPQDEMLRFKVTENHFRDRTSDHRMRNLMHFQYQRADRLLRAGAPLGKRLSGRLGLEIRAIATGGAMILWKLQQQNNVFSRPRLGKKDRLRLLWNAFRG